MTRKTVIIPMVKKKKLGTIAERTKGKPLSAMEVTNFALEQAVKRIAALEKQTDGLAQLDKQKDIVLNGMALTIKRLRDRVERMDAE